MARGIIALMGSGELTSTMVEVHKDLLTRVPNPPSPVFIDTPAGFQLNADQISQRALEYFRTRVGHNMTLASFKSSEISPFEEEKTYRTLRQSNFYLIGPGSPSYAVKHWNNSSIPGLLSQGIQSGGCLVAASAAALTIGLKTLPVYEIYKVGESLHWLDGMDICSHFGFELVIIPHWNNSEGGTHDTRFCYMGEARFEEMAASLPQSTTIVGLDEHTVLILDLKSQRGEVRGIGTVTLRSGGADRIFRKGESFPLSFLKGSFLGRSTPASAIIAPDRSTPDAGEDKSFWKRIHSTEEVFREGMAAFSPDRIATALLDLDGIIWEAHRDLESEEFISQAREIFRELIVMLGQRMESLPKSRKECLTPLIEILLRLRERMRSRTIWEEADFLRSGLNQLGIIIEDADDGTRWHFANES